MIIAQKGSLGRWSGYLNFQKVLYFFFFLLKSCTVSAKLVDFDPED